MRNSIFIVVFVFVAAVGLCFIFSPNSNQHNIPVEKISEKEQHDFYLKDSLQMDSVKAISRNQEFQKKDSLLNSSISIINFKTSEPNSAGGVDANIVWKNKSSKIVKYARFIAVPLNAVEDTVESEIGNRKFRTLKCTGPIKPGSIDGQETDWENIWYNSTITHMRIVSIELEYMDGSIISTGDSKIIDHVLLKNKK